MRTAGVGKGRVGCGWGTGFDVWGLGFAGGVVGGFGGGGFLEFWEGFVVFFKACL